MDYKHIADMLEMTFAWSVSRTFTREEAEELTQEILYQAVKSIGSLRDSTKFDSWFWRLANIQWKVFKRAKAKTRGFISFDVLSESDLMYEDKYDFITDDEYKLLRRRIAQMSAAYREIIVMHYYDNLSCKAISQKLGLPEGTVTYRLFMAREKLKKGCKKMNETALKPARLNITIMGDFRDENEYPPQFINDVLSQNILWHAYREPKSVEQLSILTGVPAVYIEDRIENLVRREAVVQPTKATVQTDFLIFDEETNNYGDELVDDMVEGLSEKFYQSSYKLTEKMISIGMQTAGRSFDEIMCYLSVMLLAATVPESMPEYLPGKVSPFPQRYDGFRWKYIGFKDVDSYSRISINSRVSIGAERSMNNALHGKMAHYNFYFAPFEHRRYLRDYEIDVCQTILQNETLDDRQKEIASELIAKGFFTKSSAGEMVCNIPVLTKAQYDLFPKRAKDAFSDTLSLYSKKVKGFVDGYVKIFPKHLEKEAQFNGFNIFAAMFKAIANDWAQRGKITIPKDAVCDALIMM